MGMKQYIMERRETAVYRVVVELADDEPNAEMVAKIRAEVGPIGSLLCKEGVVDVRHVEDLYECKVVSVKPVDPEKVTVDADYEDQWTETWDAYIREYKE